MVVAATHFGTGFPEAVAKICRGVTVDLLPVTVDSAALSKVIGKKAGFSDIAVFADGSLVAHVPHDNVEAGQALSALLMMLIDQKAAQKRARDAEASHLALVQAAIEQGAAWVNAQGQKKKKTTAKPPANRDPHAVLGVKPGASLQDLKKARDRLLTIAHSDRVENLHPALRERATELTREILEAYSELVKGKKPKAA
jgi:DnaJ-domain-containing protein 1